MLTWVCVICTAICDFFPKVYIYKSCFSRLPSTERGSIPPRKKKTPTVLPRKITTFQPLPIELESTSQTHPTQPNQIHHQWTSPIHPCHLTQILTLPTNGPPIRQFQGTPIHVIFKSLTHPCHLQIQTFPQTPIGRFQGTKMAKLSLSFSLSSCGGDSGNPQTKPMALWPSGMPRLGVKHGTVFRNSKTDKTLEVVGNLPSIMPMENEA